MPLFFVILGLILADSGVRGNAAQLFQQVAADAKGFIAFASVIIILWGIGISQTARPVTKMLLGLVFVVYFLKNGNAIVAGVDAVASAKTNNQTSPQGGNAIASSAGSSAGPAATNDLLTSFAQEIGQSANINSTAAQDLAQGGTDLSQGVSQGAVNMVQHAPQRSGGNSSQAALQTGLAVASIALMLL